MPSVLSASHGANGPGPAWQLRAGADREAGTGCSHGRRGLRGNLTEIASGRPGPGAPSQGAQAEILRLAT